MYNILLISCDPQNLDQVPDEWKEELQIDLEPIEGKEYDACFVYERVDKSISFKVREGNCYFIPGEPETIKGFSTPFVRQFDKVLSFRQDLSNIPGVKTLRNTPCLTPWRVGLDESLERDGAPRHIRTPKEMQEKPIHKTKFMSMVVSTKVGTPLQRARLKLAKVLSEQLPGLVDIYGRGLGTPELKDKADALDDYMFSIAIENSYIPNYVTEKLTDCFVCGAVPLYYGCPNLSNYYGSKGVIGIDAWDIQETINTIFKLREDPEKHYKEMISSVMSNRQELIYRHSIIARIRYWVSSVNLEQSIIEKSLNSDTVTYYW